MFNYKRKYLINKKSKFVSSNNEWFDSIYNFDNNLLKIIYNKNKVAYSIINTYFNLHFNLKHYTNYTWFCLKKIYVSLPKIKFYLNKVVINIYIYNKEKIKLLFKLKNLLKNKKRISIKRRFLLKKNKILRLLSDKKISDDKRFKLGRELHRVKRDYTIKKNTKFTTKSNLARRNRWSYTLQLKKKNLFDMINNIVPNIINIFKQENEQDILIKARKHAKHMSHIESNQKKVKKNKKYIWNYSKKNKKKYEKYKNDYKNREKFISDHNLEKEQLNQNLRLKINRFRRWYDRKDESKKKRGTWDSMFNKYYLNYKNNIKKLENEIEDLEGKLLKDLKPEKKKYKLDIKRRLFKSNLGIKRRLFKSNLGIKRGLFKSSLDIKKGLFKYSLGIFNPSLDIKRRLFKSSLGIRRLLKSISDLRRLKFKLGFLRRSKFMLITRRLKFNLSLAMRRSFKFNKLIKNLFYLKKTLKIIWNKIYLEGNPIYISYINNKKNINYNGNEPLYSYIKDYDLNNKYYLNHNKLKKLNTYWEEKYNNNLKIIFESKYTIINNILIIKNIIRKKLKYIYRQKILISKLYLNIYKFNLINMIKVRNILKKIYKKKVFINIVNLKAIYLDNSILLSAISRKLKNRRKKVFKVIKKVIKRIKITKLYSELIRYNFDKDLRIFKLSDCQNKKNKNYAFEYIKDTKIGGIRLEAKGRLTKRLTAARAISKFRYKGSLQNMYKTYFNLSNIKLKGYINSNLDYNNINSKNKLGSFGIKSWVNTF